MNYFKINESSINLITIVTDYFLILNKKLNQKNTKSKSSNRITLFIVAICIVISSLFLLFIFSENSTPPSTISTPPSTISANVLNETTPTMDMYIENLSKTHTVLVQNTPDFHLYLTTNDVNRINQQQSFVDGIRLLFNESQRDSIIESISRNDNSVVIYPVFTSAAYKEPGFYTYFAGNCDLSCVTDLSFENPEFQYTSSGATAQILYHAGYDFLTDAQVDKNPELLENYDTVILLHNEYVTQKQFDAISTHPNLIFLHPNALYALVTVDYETNTITLIQGHDFPPENPMRNGFNYEIEQRFHDYEYDNKCENWEFIEIENGFHLNCYPETIILDNYDILKKMKDL